MERKRGTEKAATRKSAPRVGEDWQVEELRLKGDISRRTVGSQIGRRLKNIVRTFTSRLKDVFAPSYGLRLV